MHNNDYNQVRAALYYLDSAIMLMEYDCIDAAKERVGLAMAALRLHLALNKASQGN